MPYHRGTMFWHFILCGCRGNLRIGHTAYRVKTYRLPVSYVLFLFLVKQKLVKFNFYTIRISINGIEFHITSHPSSSPFWQRHQLVSVLTLRCCLFLRKCAAIFTTFFRNQRSFMSTTIGKCGIMRTLNVEPLIIWGKPGNAFSSKIRKLQINIAYLS